jgi:1,2-diacylglycerol 3-alpha-glucosyltransferase
MHANDAEGGLLRILMISDVYFPRINGVSTSIRTFREHLGKLGHSSDLIAPHYQQPYPRDESIYRIPARYLFFDPEDKLMRRREILSLEAALRIQNYDLIHIHTPFMAHYAGLALARRLALPCITTYHTYFEEYLHCYVPWLPTRWLRSAARWFSRSQCNRLDAAVAPSSEIEQLLQNYGVETPIRVIPTGIDLRDFEAGDGDSFKSRYGIDPQRPVLCHVGRAAKEKNIDFLIRMLAELVRSRPDVLLVIAGEGPARSALETTAKQLGLSTNVLFVGYLDRAGALLDCYRAADAFVFASRTETQGLVLLESMALGVPVISTAMMGSKDVLRDGHGALIVDEHERLFAAAVLRVLEDEQLHRRLRETARSYAATWTAEAKAAELAALYTSLITDRSRIAA